MTFEVLQTIHSVLMAEEEKLRNRYKVAKDTYYKAKDEDVPNDRLEIYKQIKDDLYRDWDKVNDALKAFEEKTWA